MFEKAIDLLNSNEPERAIQEIHLAMAHQRNTEAHQIELALNVKEEIISTTDFLERTGWIA